MEQFFRFFGLALMGCTIGVIFQAGLILQGITLTVGLISYIIYANWER